MYKGVLVLLLLSCTNSRLLAQVAEPGAVLPDWQAGYLDLHHINTGRGSAAFYILPDGTTMLVDAGEMDIHDGRTFTPRNSQLLPDDSKKPYEWIAAYIKRFHPAPKPVLDYALITHFHDDHFGAWYPEMPVSKKDAIGLTGITGVASLVPIRMLLDRGYPSYSYPVDKNRWLQQVGKNDTPYRRTMENYFRFVEQGVKNGMQAATLKAGSLRQIRLQYNAAAYPQFSVRNLKANGLIWSGQDSSAVAYFPPANPELPFSWPDENSMSLALLLQYGPFKYYTGGDNPGVLFYGNPVWRDVETPMAKVTGRVDVATLDHHGNRDAVNEFQVKTLQPRVWIGQSWSADHPGHEVLVRMVSPYLYDGPRDLFATNMLEANRLVIGPLIDRSYKSQQGHILVRVLPGGDRYYVIILEDKDETARIKAVFGPYTALSK
ncbi:hypothetical protein [Flavihumibacter sp. CACIAM 22H1]|uniref:hypothetical protein n=1 Tax=Flavihumibacter sp. CACIAM 22H1 TaxID=1812911 RepID=UPI0007A935ED|nr:hypothetical protein [Flavihumibacter sp. CACIAM 22H1]KYP13188.1 MAG: hypothetical protein A1D16_12685 [Flavihumibacter sp. CACIAM 22H1]